MKPFLGSSNRRPLVQFRKASKDKFIIFVPKSFVRFTRIGALLVTAF